MRGLVPNRSSHVLAVLTVALAAHPLIAQVEKAEPAPPTVVVCHPAVREVCEKLDFVGRAEALRTVEVRARVRGTLGKAHHPAGARVKTGDLLFEIDPRPYQIALDRAQAEVLRCEAHAKRLAADRERTQRLVTTGVVSHEEVDRIEGDLGEAKAELAEARAGSELARLDLESTRIVAPIDGPISASLISPGNLVKADESLLAIITDADPIAVGFDVPERTFLRLEREQAAGRGKALHEIPIQVALADEDRCQRAAKITDVGTSFDPNTGTIRWHAALPNPNGLILPGMFLRVQLTIGAPHKALTVPGECIMQDQGHAFVYTVNDRSLTERQPVSIGIQDEGRTEITEGLKESDEVIVPSPGSLQAGMAVKTKEWKAPGSDR